jgi:Protein kinase domain
VEVQQTLGDRYALLDELGRGGMAVVWRARDQVLGRPVAVKVLAGRFAGDPQSRARIRDEARAAAALSHPNIAQVYDYGEAEAEGVRLPYVVMELINGPTLQQRVSAGPLPPRTVFRICAEVAAALAAAHLDGLVHRDIKMANIMVTPGGAKVVDFGIAAVAGPALPEEMLVGTPAYLAPERLTGGAIVPASDVYALGVLLYRLLAQESPWSVETTTQMLRAHMYVEPQPLPRLPGVSPAIAELIERCLHKDPAARPTAGEVSTRLADAGEASALDAGHASPLARVPKPADGGADDFDGETSVRSRRRAGETSEALVEPIVAGGTAGTRSGRRGRLAEGLAGAGAAGAGAVGRGWLVAGLAAAGGNAGEERAGAAGRHSGRSGAAEDGAYPATDHPATHDPATDYPATDHPADYPATHDPATDGLATDHPATDGLATDHPATDGLATDHPATDHPATGGPATDDPATGDPTTDDPAADGGRRRLRRAAFMDPGVGAEAAGGRLPDGDRHRRGTGSSGDAAAAAAEPVGAGRRGSSTEPSHQAEWGAAAAGMRGRRGGPRDAVGRSDQTMGSPGWVREAGWAALAGSGLAGVPETQLDPHEPDGFRGWLGSLKRPREFLVLGIVAALVAASAGYLLADKAAQRQAEAPVPGAATTAPAGSGGTGSGPASTDASSPAQPANHNLPAQPAVSAAAPGATVTPGAKPTAKPSSAAGAEPGDDAPGTSSPVAEGKRFSSPGGSVSATCAGVKATLSAWEPADGFTVQTVVAGPAVTTSIVFAGTLRRYRITVTCVAGQPTPVVLPL